MATIVVSPLSGIEAAIGIYRPSHVMSLLSPEHMIDVLTQFSDERHLRLAMSDVADTWASESPPAPEHIDRLLMFGRGWPGVAPLLVHCWAGVSRSMAAAYIVLCDRTPPGCELMAATILRARAPHAFPNPLMVRLADAALGRSGRMSEAIAQIGRGQIVAEGRCVELPVSLAGP